MESYITLGLIVYAAFTPVLYSWLNRDKSTPLNLIAPRFGRSKDGKEVYLSFLNPLNLAWFIKGRNRTCDLRLRRLILSLLDKLIWSATLSAIFYL